MCMAQGDGFPSSLSYSKGGWSIKSQKLRNDHVQQKKWNSLTTDVNVNTRNVTIPKIDMETKYKSMQEFKMRTFYITADNPLNQPK